MEQSLDKLRDKADDLRCYFETENGNVGFIIRKQGASFYDVCFLKGTCHVIHRKQIKKVIGKPITRGRIAKLENDYQAKQTDETIERFERVTGGMYLMMIDIEGFDQTEEQRMKHEERPELLKLLEEFALLIPDDNE